MTISYRQVINKDQKKPPFQNYLTETKKERNVYLTY